jgi:hypothetical protein
MIMTIYDASPCFFRIRYFRIGDRFYHTFPLFSLIPFDFDLTRIRI